MSVRRITLHSNGRTYVVRTDRDGREYVLCDGARLYLLGQMYDDLQSGGSLRARQTVRAPSTMQRALEYADTLKDVMVDCGWSRGFVESVFRRIPRDTWSRMHLDGLRPEEAIKELRETWCADTSGPIDRLVERLGFSGDAADDIVLAFDALDSYSREQLVDAIIEYATGKCAPIGVPGQRFYFPDSPEDTVFEDSYGVKHMNVFLNDRRGVETAARTLRPPADAAGAMYFFHATNWRSAVSIARSGPLVHKGRECLDFGMSPAFYLTPSAATAIDYTRVNDRRWSGEIAIAVFVIALPGDTARRFRSCDRDWERTVASSRRCVDDRNELDDYDFVYGPMLANVSDVLAGRRARPHDPPRWQLAVKGTAQAALKRSLVGVLWGACQRS